MFSIVDYEVRYKPYDKSGGELKSADWVKLPAKPRGEGLAELLKYNRGLQVFAIWCLLLEKTTNEKPENRGKLLNHKEQPATVKEIASGISLSSKVKLVEYALGVLVSIGWLQKGSTIKFDKYNLNYRPLKDPYELLKKRLITVKSRAKTNNIQFDIDYDYLKSIWDKQKGKCAITKLPFEDIPEGLGAKPMALSIDRINPPKGYVRGNIRLVLYSVNVSINQWGIDYFLQISKACVDHNLQENRDETETASDQLPTSPTKSRVVKSRVEKSNRDYSPEFEIFWKKFKGRWNPENDRYIKVGKFAAWVEWQKLNEADQQKATAVADKVGGKYVPDAERWLKRRLFDDFTLKKG